MPFLPPSQQRQSTEGMHENKIVLHNQNTHASCVKSASRYMFIMVGVSRRAFNDSRPFAVLSGSEQHINIKKILTGNVVTDFIYTLKAFTLILRKKTYLISLNLFITSFSFLSHAPLDVVYNVMVNLRTKF